MFKQVVILLSLWLLTFGTLCAQDEVSKSPEELFERFESVARFKSFLEKRQGSSSIIEMEATFFWFFTADVKIITAPGNKFRFEVRMMGKDMVVASDGENIYSRKNKNGAVEKLDDSTSMKAFEGLTKIGNDDTFDLRGNKEFVYLGTKGWRSNKCDVIEFRNEEEAEQLYFNIETGLLDQVSKQYTDKNGRRESVTIEFKEYVDYHDGDLLIPQRLDVSMMGVSMDVEIVRFDLGVATDESLFRIEL